MPRDRDVGAFDERASRYDSGWRAKMHQEIVLRTLQIALSLEPAPKRVLDVGCGTGLLLGNLAERLPDATLTGIDAAPRMVAAARNAHGKFGVELTEGTAENLPFCSDASGYFVCVDQFSSLLWPTLWRHARVRHGRSDAWKRS